MTAPFTQQILISLQTMKNHKFKDPNVNLYNTYRSRENFTVKNNYTVETNCEKLTRE